LISENLRKEGPVLVLVSSNIKNWTGLDFQALTVSIECSVKFDTNDTKVYLPQVVSTEEEQQKLAVKQLSKSSEQKLIQESIKSIDVVNPLRDNFEKQPDIEGCPKHI
jgi:hypothetical protein